MPWPPGRACHASLTRWRPKSTKPFAALRRSIGTTPWSPGSLGVLAKLGEMTQEDSLVYAHISYTYNL